MLINIHREYNTNRIFLSCLGLWPFQRKLARYSLSMICFALEISYLPFELLTLYIHRDDMLIVFESLYQVSVTMAFLVKLLNQFWNRNKFRRLYEIMENHWNIFTNDLEVGVLKNFSHLSQRFTVSYSSEYLNIKKKNYPILVYLMMSLFITIPSLGPMFLDVIIPLNNKSRPRHLALFAEYGIDQDKYFMLIFFYTAMMITVGISIMVAVDTMHIACTAHACSLFQLIGQQIENIISNKNIDEVNETKSCTNIEYQLVNEEIVYRQYIVCLKKHQLALEYVDVLNNTHKIVGISFSLLIAAIFSLVGMRIVYVLDQVEEMIRYTFIIMGAMLQLLIACYSGQRLMDESQNIFHQAYAAEWYHFSPRIKSLFMITLYRTIVPCQLTAGNLFPLSMAVFAAVVRTSTSYFTAFLSLKG